MKRDLKKYLQSLEKEQLEEQILDLYDRFKNVKTYYNFAFNPNEDKLIEECKWKIKKEYFPESRRKPKARRSVAQKILKHFMTLGVQELLIAEVMLYNLEIAQSFSAVKTIKQESFYKSMQKSYQEALEFINTNGLNSTFDQRLKDVLLTSENLDWMNYSSMQSLYNKYYSDEN
jgi:hypothetical protein